MQNKGEETYIGYPTIQPRLLYIALNQYHIGRRILCPEMFKHFGTSIHGVDFSSISYTSRQRQGKGAGAAAEINADHAIPNASCIFHQLIWP